MEYFESKVFSINAQRYVNKKKLRTDYIKDKENLGTQNVSKLLQIILIKSSTILMMLLSEIPSNICQVYVYIASFLVYHDDIFTPFLQPIIHFQVLTNTFLWSSGSM